MIVKEAMTRDVVTVTPQTTVESAASQMKRRNVGILPVTEGQRAVGMLTDRDIVLRSSAEGMDPRSTVVKEIMTPRVIDCMETESVEEAGRIMEKNRVRRVVVTNQAGAVVGMISLADLAKKVRNPVLTNDVVRGISTVQPKEP